MIKIEFPANRPDIASAIGKALIELSTHDCRPNSKNNKALTPEEIEALLEEFSKRQSLNNEECAPTGVD